MTGMQNTDGLRALTAEEIDLIAGGDIHVSGPGTREPFSPLVFIRNNLIVNQQAMALKAELPQPAPAELGPSHLLG